MGPQNGPRQNLTSTYKLVVVLLTMTADKKEPTMTRKRLRGTIWNQNGLHLRTPSPMSTDLIQEKGFKHKNNPKENKRKINQLVQVNRAMDQSRAQTAGCTVKKKLACIGSTAGHPSGNTARTTFERSTRPLAKF